MGEMIPARDGRFYEVYRQLEAFVRSVSISFSHDIIRFQVGMLWDANLILRQIGTRASLSQSFLEKRLPAAPKV